MKIFFTASYPGRLRYQSYYDTIVDLIKETDNQIISLEAGSYSDVLSKKELKLSKGQIHHLYVKKSIFKSKAVIIEASENEFQLGYEATLGLLLNKPVLCVSSTTDYSKTINHSRFTAKRYKTEKELTKIIKNFLKEVKDKHLSVRFNGFLSPEQKTFLDWYSEKTGDNASEIIRDLIEKKMKNTPGFEEEISSLNSHALKF